MDLNELIATIPDFESWQVTQIEMEDDWKGISLQRVVAKGDSIHEISLAQRVNSPRCCRAPRLR